MKLGNDITVRQTLESKKARESELESQIKEVRGQIRILEELLDEQSTRIISSRLYDDCAVTYAGEVRPDYSNFPLTQAVRDAAPRMDEKGFTLSQLQKVLLDFGFKPKSSKFYNQLAVSVMRLVDKGEFGTEKRGSKRIYFFKKDKQ